MTEKDLSSLGLDATELEILEGELRAAFRRGRLRGLEEGTAEVFDMWLASEPTVPPWKRRFKTAVKWIVAILTFLFLADGTSTAIQNTDFNAAPFVSECEECVDCSAWVALQDETEVETPQDLGTFKAFYKIQVCPHCDEPLFYEHKNINVTGHPLEWREISPGIDNNGLCQTCGNAVACGEKLGCGPAKVVPLETTAAWFQTGFFGGGYWKLKEDLEPAQWEVIGGKPTEEGE